MVKWRRSKQRIQGQFASFLREKGPRGGKEYIAIVFSILTRKPKIISIHSNLIY